MDKQELLASAGKLKQVSDAALSEYRSKSELFVSKMNSMMIKRKDILKLVGEKNLEMMQDNHANHARFMTSIFAQYVPEVFVETILWVFRAYRSHGFTTNYWAAQLNQWILIIQKELQPEILREIKPYYEWMQVHIPIFVQLSDDNLESEYKRH